MGTAANNATRDRHLRCIGRPDHRKLIPRPVPAGLQGRLPQPTWIVGFSRSEFTDATWRETLAESTAQFVGDEFDEATWQYFAEKIHYHRGDVTSGEDMAQLATYLDELEAGRGLHARLLPVDQPSLYERAIAQLGASWLGRQGRVPRRLVIEKPFGTDLASAQVAERRGSRRFRRAADLSHRSLSGQGNRAESAGVAVRQQHFRADLESQLHRSRADHRGRRSRRRQSRRATTMAPACCATCFRIICCSC